MIVCFSYRLLLTAYCLPIYGSTCATVNCRSALSGKACNLRPRMRNEASGDYRMKFLPGSSGDKEIGSPQLLDSFFPLRPEPCAFRLLFEIHPGSSGDKVGDDPPLFASFLALCLAPCAYYLRSPRGNLEDIVRLEAVPLYWLPNSDFSQKPYFCH